MVPRVVGLTEEAHQRKGSTGITKQWTEATFFDEILKNRTDKESQVARHILDWAKKKTTGIWWGKGKFTGSFVPTYDAPNGTHYQLFAVFTNGTIQVYYQSYMRRPVFDSEDKRLELLEKLNRIDGVSIPQSSITKYPSIQFLNFTDTERIKSFCQVFEWFMGEVDNG
jgi:hypothetical protein